MAKPLLLHTSGALKAFHGDSFEDVEDWLDSFERVASFNEWYDCRKLRMIYSTLENSAQTWFKNHQPTMNTWQELRRELLATYRSGEQKERA